MTVASLSASTDIGEWADSLVFRGVRNVPLNFQLGEWRLFSISRRLAVYECADRRTCSPLSLANLPEAHGADGFLIKALPAPFTPSTRPPSGWMGRVLREYPRHLVDLSTSYDSYMAKFSAKTRSTLKRKLRKFQELSGGVIDWKAYRAPGEISAFLPLARGVSAKTYQERLLNAGLPGTPQFKEEALSRAARDAVRAYILFLHGRPVSYLYLPVEDGSVIYAYLGYDPEVAEHSPGTVLQLLAMESLFAERRFTAFDFTEGAGQHKELFATRVEHCLDVLILRRTLSTAMLSAAHAGFIRIEAALARLLDRLGLRQRLKALLRSLARSRR